MDTKTGKIPLTEDQRVQGILRHLNEGHIEQAAQEAKDLYVFQGLAAGGMPVAVSAIRDEGPLTEGLARAGGTVRELTLRGHSRWLRGIVRLLRKELSTEEFELSFSDLNAAASLDEQTAMARVRFANGILFLARYVPSLRLKPCADLRTAKGEIKEALRLSGSCAPAHHALGLLRLTTAQGMRISGGDPERAYTRAMNAFAAAILHDPTYARSHQNLGVAKAALARHRKRHGKPSADLLSDAVVDLQRASSLDPSIWRASYKAAQLLIELGQGDQAREFVERCRQIGGGSCRRLGKLEAMLWHSVLPAGPLL